MSDRIKLRWIDDHMTSHRVGAAGAGGPHPADGSVVSPAVPAPDREALRARHADCSEKMAPRGCDTIRALDGWDAAEQDAARLAEALRTAPVAVEQTPQTAAWEVQRHRALAAHRERTDPGPIGTLDVDEGER